MLGNSIAKKRRVFFYGFGKKTPGVFFMALALASCKTAAPPVNTPPPEPPRAVVPLDKRVAWILRLEAERVLRDDAPGTPHRDFPATGPRMLLGAITPDLEALSIDTDPNVRRRAMLGIGRTGLADGVPALVSGLGDTDESVRVSAAFGLGLLGSPAGVDPLIAALKDQSALVRGRAADALGLIGDPRAAGPVADAAAGCADLFTGIQPDDEEWPKAPEIEACRLSLFSLVRLKQYDALARVALDAQGQPVSRWWPVAYALQRINDKRAVPALLTLASTDGVYSPAFALRGLGAAADKRLVPLAQAIASREAADIRLRVQAVRALGQTGGSAAVQPLLQLLVAKSTPSNLALETVQALGAIGDPQAFDTILDFLTDAWPSMRSAAFAAAAKCNPTGFLLVVSSFDRDKDWSVRASLATTLESLPADRVRSEIEELSVDADARVRGPALEALVHIGAPDLTKRLYDALAAPDFVVRATAARLVGETKPVDGAERLRAAYTRAATDASPAARESTLAALAQYGPADSSALLHDALNDKEWTIRLRAAQLLKAQGEVDVFPARPAPLRESADVFESAAILHPSFSPHAFIETRYGTIEVELNVVETPFTTRNFVELARSGFFNGVLVHRLVSNFVVQAGDPRGDGEGGPGYEIKDELSSLPFLRGSMGMALSGPDTGGSQFFITVSPQPHLDGKYTVFGKVVQGMSILEQLSQWDAIERVRIWDGVTLK
jgi:cyclophilin family peptidyl-prolyl cis-trans isomerase/HEAT repeat protein